VYAFLERLLLLTHLTAGQSARGSEILSLRYVNTVNGHHRNILGDAFDVEMILQKETIEEMRGRSFDDPFAAGTTNFDMPSIQGRRCTVAPCDPRSNTSQGTLVTTTAMRVLESVYRKHIYISS
jgi:hypothetical protein